MDCYLEVKEKFKLFLKLKEDIEYHKKMRSVFVKNNYTHGVLRSYIDDFLKEENLQFINSNYEKYKEKFFLLEKEYNCLTFI